MRPRSNYRARTKKALRLYSEMRAAAPEQPGTATFEIAVGQVIKEAFEAGYKRGHDDGFDEGACK